MKSYDMGRRPGHGVGVCRRGHGTGRECGRRVMRQCGEGSGGEGTWDGSGGEGTWDGSGG